jgi:hypothetical protein
VLVNLVMCGFAQEKPEVLAIRKTVNIINATKNLTVVKLTNNDIPGYEAIEASIESFGYFKGKLLQKIIEKIDIIQGVTTKEYYFENNQLVFVYEVEQVYEMNEDGDFTNKLGKKSEARYYFKNKQLVAFKSNFLTEAGSNAYKSFTGNLAEQIKAFNKKLNGKK